MAKFEVLFYCEQCEQARPVLIEPLVTDDRGGLPWGDIVCSVCNFVIATISANQPGIYVFKRLESEWEKS